MFNLALKHFVISFPQTKTYYLDLSCHAIIIQIIKGS